MTLVEIEGKWINVEMVCAVREDPANGEGFVTEVVLASQSVRLRMPVRDVVAALEKGAKG